VKKSPTPLCSDTFSNFSIQNSEAFELDINNIHKYIVYNTFCQFLLIQFLFPRTLTQKIIPDFAKSVATKIAAWWPNTQPKVDDFRAIEFEAHQQGINIRYLSLVRNALPPGSDPRCHTLFLSLLVGRVLKNLIRAHMRALKSPQSITYIKYVQWGGGLKFLKSCSKI